MSCPHLNQYLGQNGTDSYRTIHVNLISAWTVSGLERKARSTNCMTCGLTGPRPHACLHCVHVSCSYKVTDQVSGSGSHREVHGV